MIAKNNTYPALSTQPPVRVFSLRSVTMKKLPRLEVPLTPGMPDWVAAGPNSCAMPEYFQDWYPSYVSFPVRPDDAWVLTFAKAGKDIKPVIGQNGTVLYMKFVL